MAPSVSFSTGNSFFPYDWTVTLQPGESAAFLHFTAQRNWDDVSGATSQAQALVALTDPQALEGLSDIELSQIVNFEIPGITIPAVGTVSGQVLSAAGTPVAGALVYAIDDATSGILARIMTGPDGRYRFTGVSSTEAVVLLAISPDDPLIEAMNFVTFTTNGQEISGVTLQFQP
jgi:hypothetical protein